MSVLVALAVSLFLLANAAALSADQERHVDAKAGSSIDLVLGTQDLVRLPMDSVVTNNNVRITRSDIVFTPTDQRTLVDTIQDLVQNSQDQDDMTLANAIRMVLGIKRHRRDADTKAVDQQIKSILGCRRNNNNRIMLRKCIHALVRMKMPATSYASDINAASVVAKRSPSSTQKDVYYAKPGTSAMKPSSGAQEGDKEDKNDDDKDDDGEAASIDEDLATPYRVAFRYTHGNSYRYGWRYPVAYWNSYGHRFYPGTCGYGHTIGAYYYC